MIEDEAEEEDEEGLMGGLDDYGFGSGTKDKVAYEFMYELVIFH